MINIKSFIVTIILYLYLDNLFSLCIYNAVYFIAILCFLQKSSSFVQISSLRLSAQKTYKQHLYLVLSYESQHAEKASTKSSFLLGTTFIFCKYACKSEWLHRCFRIKKKVMQASKISKHLFQLFDIAVILLFYLIICSTLLCKSICFLYRVYKTCQRCQNF